MDIWQYVAFFVALVIIAGLLERIDKRLRMQIDRQSELQKLVQSLCNTTREISATLNSELRKREDFDATMQDLEDRIRELSNRA